MNNQLKNYPKVCFHYKSTGTTDDNDKKNYFCFRKKSNP